MREQEALNRASKVAIENSREKIYIGRMSSSGQERKGGMSSNTVLKPTVFVSNNNKNTSFTEMLRQLTSFFTNKLR